MKNSILIFILTIWNVCLNGENMNDHIPKTLDAGYLKVSDKHEIFYETFGNPKGIPVVILHGGPGAGCTTGIANFFDLKTWHIVMFDQRGAMRSKPFACMEDNSLQAIIGDIEHLRNHLGIKQWVCFGGSFGSLLALAYGQAHPESCLGFILRSIFLGRTQDYLHAVYDLGLFFPEAYEEFLSIFTEEEKKDLVSACYKKIMDPNPEIHLQIAKHYLKWISHAITPIPDPAVIQHSIEDDKFALTHDPVLIRVKAF